MHYKTFNPHHSSHIDFFDRSVERDSTLVFPRVLLVDHSPGFRELLRSELEQRGYDVEAAEDGQRALLRLDFFKPDVILLELSLPIMDGLAFLAELREYTRWCDMPVIVIASKADESKVRKAKQFDVRSFMLKSEFSFERLQEQISECLENVLHA